MTLTADKEAKVKSKKAIVLSEDDRRRGVTILMGFRSVELAFNAHLRDADSLERISTEVVEKGMNNPAFVSYVNRITEGDTSRRYDVVASLLGGCFDRFEQLSIRRKETEAAIASQTTYSYGEP